jgi:hypothetical protein
MGVLTHVLVAQNGIRLGAKARSAVELILTKRGNKDEHVGKRHITSIPQRKPLKYISAL